MLFWALSAVAALLSVLVRHLEAGVYRPVAMRAVQAVEGFTHVATYLLFAWQAVNGDLRFSHFPE